MLELRKELIKGLKEHTGLNVYLPYQEISGLTFPLITLEMSVADGERTLNHGVVSYSVSFDIYIYADSVEELLNNEQIKKYFHLVGMRCTYESNPSLSHHWYKQYQFECEVWVRKEDYIIL